MNKLFKFFIILIVLINFSCSEPEDIEYGNFKQITKIDSLSKDDHNILLILDNLGNQLFYYDSDSKCLFDFKSDLPNENGILLSEYPYTFSISDDQEKVIVLSSSKVLTIISNNFESYKKDCNIEVAPNIDATYQLEQLPDFVYLEKDIDFRYRITLIYNKTGKIEILDYNEGIFTLTETKEFNKEINTHFIFKKELYFSFKNESKIIKLDSDLVEKEILFNTEIGNIDKFIVSEKYIFIYNGNNKTIMIYNNETAQFENIENNLNPLDSSSDSKKFKLVHSLTNMELYKQEYVVKDGEKLNKTGYLKDNQLLEGEYLFFTDDAGYLSFITIDLDYKLITNFPKKYKTIEEYKKVLNKRFLKLHTPLKDEYKLKVSSLLQVSYCTQFNSYEADICFYQVDQDQNDAIDNYVKLTDNAKNRDYTLLGERFSFIYEGVIKDTLFSDGSFSDKNTFFSTKLDLNSIKIKPTDLMIEIMSEFPESNKESCIKLKKGEISLPILSVDGHNITIDNSKYEGLSSCFNEAFVFRVRVKDKFLVTASESDYYDTVSYCRSEEECESSENFKNDLFEIKLFSYKEEKIRRDATISFYLSENLNNFRYRHSIVSPIDSLFIDQDGNSKQGTYILDQFNNNIIKIDPNNWNSIDYVIQ